MGTSMVNNVTFVADFLFYYNVTYYNVTIYLFQITIMSHVLLR